MRLQITAGSSVCICSVLFQYYLYHDKQTVPDTAWEAAGFHGSYINFVKRFFAPVK